MTSNSEKTIKSNSLSMYECQVQLNDWTLGHYSLKETISIIQQYLKIFQKLELWKNQGLLICKPTRSLAHTFTFWVDKSLIDLVFGIKSISGGFSVSKITNHNLNSSTYKGKKANPRPRRVLLDIGIDSANLVNSLERLGLEVVSLWNKVADLFHHEIIEICTAQYIDLLVTTNERLLMPKEEWINYLMPNRTRLYFVSEKPLAYDEQFARSLKQKAYEKRRYIAGSKGIEGE